MTLFNAIASQNAASDTILRCKVEQLPAEYTTEDVNKYRKSLESTARSVPSRHDGGSVGYVGVITSTTRYQEILGNDTAVFTEDTDPGDTPVYNDSDTPAQIAKAEATFSQQSDAFYTLKGVKKGLRELIIDTAPKGSLSELEHDTTGFDDVEPRDMLAHLEQNATVTDCIDLDELITLTEQPVPLDGDVTLKTYFEDLERDIKALKKHHDVPTSKKRMEIKILRQLKEHGDFKDEVTKWEGEVSAANRTWDAFKKCFIKADRERRQRNKYANKPAGATEYGSANNVNGVDVDDLRRMIQEGLGTIAKAAEDTINLTFEKKMAGGTDTSSSSSNDAVADLAKKIKALEEENKKLKQRGRTRTRCKHCGHFHHSKFDISKCWGKQENRHLAPEGWKPAKDE